MDNISANPGAHRENAWWGSHFVISNGRVRVPASGGDMKIDMLLLGDVRRWLGHYLLVRLKSVGNALTRRTGPAIWFAPIQPRPWYIIWAACVWEGLPIAARAEDADVTFYFEDRTCAAYTPSSPAHRGINLTCTNVSKSRVAEVFESVFGYALAIEPENFKGVAVEKSEENGRHAGRLIYCPAARQSGRAYQRFIDTAVDGYARDLRTCCVGGSPVIVMVKRKLPSENFSIQTTSVAAATVESVFSPSEIALIERFNQAMGLDWGGLDVLREAKTGRLYIVDANKTDMGPPIRLSWRDRVRVMNALGAALRALVMRRREAEGRGHFSLRKGGASSSPPPRPMI